MQVILLKNVNNLGLVGDVVNVAKGYFRNYLFPRKIAVNANPASLKELNHQKRMIESRQAQEKELALKLQDQINSLNLVIEKAASDNNKLFGSVTSAEISTALEEKEISIDRKMIKTDPIKQAGIHEITIRLHPEVDATLKLNIKKVVEAKEEKEVKEPKTEVVEEAQETEEA
jgi:large subunit ribosomal protein L9